MFGGEMNKILVVDDDRRIRNQIKGVLLEANYRVFEAKDAEDALEIFLKEKEIALVIIDVDLPMAKGWQLFRIIRQSSDVPIIMITAKQSESDEVQGFEAGADDFLVKPFSLLVLVARIQRILRRTEEGEKSKIIEAGAIRLNKLSYEVDIEGDLLELSYKEFKLLEYFLKNQGVMLSREKILSNVWEFDYYGDARTIDTHVKKLRKKMKEKRHYIKTIRGLGYKFEQSTTRH